MPRTRFARPIRSVSSHFSPINWLCMAAITCRRDCIPALMILAFDQPANAGCLERARSDRVPVLAEEGGGGAALLGGPALVAPTRGASAAMPQLVMAVLWLAGVLGSR
jgi:hypothetical protein